MKLIRARNGFYKLVDEKGDIWLVSLCKDWLIATARMQWGFRDLEEVAE